MTPEIGDLVSFSVGYTRFGVVASIDYRYNAGTQYQTAETYCLVKYLGGCYVVHHSICRVIIKRYALLMGTSA